jgi:hypothetical protein
MRDESVVYNAGSGRGWVDDNRDADDKYGRGCGEGGIGLGGIWLFSFCTIPARCCN